MQSYISNKILPWNFGWW